MPEWGTTIISVLTFVAGFFGGWTIKSKRQTATGGSQIAGRDAISVSGQVAGRDITSVSGDNARSDHVTYNLGSWVGFDPARVADYKDDAIQEFINRGDNHIRQEICFNLILQGGSLTLIENCIDGLTNQANKATLAVRLFDHDQSSPWVTTIIDSVASNGSRRRLVQEFVARGRVDLAKSLFSSISNDADRASTIEDLVGKNHCGEAKTLFDGGSLFANAKSKDRAARALAECGEAAGAQSDGLG
jgi:hypothetical protein